MSTGRPVDDALSKNHIDEAIRTLASRIKIDATHWVPYLGGYSKDWRSQPAVYFDVRFPDSLKVGGKIMQPYRYILIHEAVEKSLMDELGLSYEVAHDFATSAEKSAVEADGFSWADYTDALKLYITHAVQQPQGIQPPNDLDLSPYQQERSKELTELQSYEVR